MFKKTKKKRERERERKGRREGNETKVKILCEKETTFSSEAQTVEF